MSENGPDTSRKKMLLPVLAVIMLVIMAGEAMLTAALPEITNEFEVPGVFESWILPMVLLVGAAASPFIGTAGDQYGRKKLLLICLLIYLAGLFCGYFSWNIWILLVSRAMQGIGIASFPLAYALVRNQLTHRDADIGIGVISATYGAGMFLGVIIGSFLIESFSWRYTYLSLIPAVFILFLLALGGIRDSGDVTGSGAECNRYLDWTGFITLLGALIMGLAAVSLSDTGEYGLILRILLVIGGVTTGYLFIRQELKAPVPLADLRLIKQRPMFLLIIIGFLTILTFMMLLQEMPFLIRSETGLGLSAGYVGFILMPGTLCDMLAGPLTGRMIISRGVRPACLSGSFLLFGAVILLLLGGFSSLAILTLSWMLFSAGMSVTATACLIAVIDFVPLSRSAEATGLMQSLQTVGGMVGPVITGLVLAGLSVSSVRNGEVWTVPATVSFAQVHWIALVLVILILIFSLMLRPGIQGRENRPVE